MKKWLCLLFALFLCATAVCDPAKTVAIFTYKVLGANAWGPESIKSGIHGSEEAVIYMSQKLATRGYKVVVFGHPIPNSPHSLTDANPRFIDVNADYTSHFDIAISWRMPDIARQLKLRADKVYLWPHDVNYQKLSDDLVLGFDGVLWLSAWQREQWCSVNPGFSRYTTIFGNGINLDHFNAIQERKNPYSCIYSSNYARGLDILLNIWPVVKSRFPRATLDIYYGWQHWGLLSQAKVDMMRAQVAALASFGVTEHGLVSHEELTRAHERVSLWTYPCIAPETFCITAIRAQAAGNIPVIIEGTALKETVRHGYKCTDPDTYLFTLLEAMQSIEKTTVQDRLKLREFILEEYTWDVLAGKWKEFFEK